MKLITFDIFKPFDNLIHAFSTRMGGVSAPPFDALNLGLHTPDEQQNVQRNRQLFFRELGISRKRIVFPQQVHSANVKIVTKPGIANNCDGLITAQKNLFLSVQTADCFPVFIFDPRKEVVALVHSGWRGTAADICGKTIEAMNDRFDCKVEDLFAAVGPGVQQSCYQVDDKTATFFKADFLQPDGKGHYKLDVQGAIVDQLKKRGIPETRIEVDYTCTHCAAQLYYSYRRDGIQSGRMMGIIGIKAD